MPSVRTETRASSGDHLLRHGTERQQELPRSFPESVGRILQRPQDQPNYIVVEVAAHTLVVKTVRQDGMELDTFSIDKTKGVDSDTLKAPIPSKNWVKYSSPTLVVFGNVLSLTMYRHAPVLKDGKWYLDLAAMAGYIGATVSPRDAGVAWSTAERSFSFPPRAFSRTVRSSWPRWTRSSRSASPPPSTRQRTCWRSHADSQEAARTRLPSPGIKEKVH